VQDDLEQEVAQLFRHVLRVAFVQQVQDLVGFLYQVRAQRGVGLLAVPGASVRRAQLRDDVSQAVVFGEFGGVGHGRDLWRV
jgi:hypothetical protein